MSDIFISYARSTEAQAKQIADALGALGYSVWRDNDLPSHRAYSDVIEEQLQTAKAVVVVWSAEAVKSEWVRSEADRARADHKLVQFTVDGARLPMPFDQIQCADLTDWTGGADTPGWRKVVAGVADLVGRTPGKPAAPPAAPAGPLLAVLAFDNLSGDPEMTYFSDGLSEEILQTVARTTQLKVIGRSSSFQFRGAEKSARRVARELSCTHLLDGSVRRGGARVRVAANLIECAAQTMLWSDRFDRELADVFALQDEIAAAVAEALNHTFEPSADVAPIDPVAYELYLRARAPTMAVAVGPAAADWMWPSDAGLLEEALARAPKFAQAWAELALAKAVHAQSQPSVKEFNALSDQAKRAAVMALSLDEQSGGAFAAQSLLLPLCGKFEEREQLLEKGRAATPNDELLLLQSSVFLSRVGRLDEALDLVTQAYELNPLIPNVVYWRAETLFNVGRQAEAFALWDQGRARWPAHPGMHLTAMFYAATVGDWARVDALMPGADELAAIHPREAAGLAAVGYLRDPPADARDVLKEVGRGQIARTGTLEFTFIGFIAFAGFVDSAYDLVDAASFAHLSEPGPAASANGSPHALFDAQNAPLRDDVRFVALCARLGLCDYWVNTDRWPDCADQIPYDFRDEARRLVGGPRG